MPRRHCSSRALRTSLARRRTRSFLQRPAKRKRSKKRKRNAAAGGQRLAASYSAEKRRRSMHPAALRSGKRPTSTLDANGWKAAQSKRPQSAGPSVWIVFLDGSFLFSASPSHHPKFLVFFFSHRNLGARALGLCQSASRPLLSRPRQATTPCSGALFIARGHTDTRAQTQALPRALNRIFGYSLHRKRRPRTSSGHYSGSLCRCTVRSGC